VDLRTVVLADPRVPSTDDRKKHIRKLAEKVNPNQSCKILEGIILKNQQEYIALIEYEHDSNAHIVGDRITIRNIPFNDISSWRRLAVGLGDLIEIGKLKFEEIGN
ncbi:MAG: hypothetical protein ACYSUG_07960, partial [Planctomycetota bacterium]